MKVREGNWNLKFLRKFNRALKERNSVLCVGLDPALSNQRNSNTISEKYFQNSTDADARLNFCLRIIDETAEFCIAAKPNEQYLRGFTAAQHMQLTNRIRELGLLSIYDCKLGDIRDTAESAFYYFSKWGYDAVTVNPFPGNLGELVSIAHEAKPPVGVIVLTLMSNPEAERIMKKATIDGTPLFVEIAKDVRKFSADGCVVGATGHVTSEDIALIRRESGNDKVFLIPGIGTQKGDPLKVIKAGGKNLLINVGRDVIYSENPRKKASEYSQLFNRLRKLQE